MRQYDIYLIRPRAKTLTKKASMKANTPKGAIEKLRKYAVLKKGTRLLVLSNANFKKFTYIANG